MGIVAASIGNFAVVASEIQFEKNKTRLLEKSLDENLILNLDADGGGSIDKEEFVVGMLLLLELVSEEDVNLWRTRFEELDADGSGELDADDLKQLALQEKEKNEIRKAKLEERAAKMSFAESMKQAIFGKKNDAKPSEAPDTSLMRQDSNNVTSQENPAFEDSSSLTAL